MALKNSMRIKFLKEFRNPMINRMAKVGEFMNVPKNQFWFRRINAKDCEEIKGLSSKKAQPTAPKIEQKDSKKGRK